MPELDLPKEINIAIKAALSSGKHLKKNKTELNKNSSSDPRDVKLDADVASENLIKKIINESSNYEILAEESGKSNDDLGDTFWVIDPLDGTGLGGMNFSWTAAIYLNQCNHEVANILDTIQ